MCAGRRCQPRRPGPAEQRDVLDQPPTPLPHALRIPRRACPRPVGEGSEPAPPFIGRGCAALLNAGTRPFNFINYLGSAMGSRLDSDRSMTPKFDAEIRAMRRRLDRESEESFGRSMALSGALGPLLQGHHDAGRRVPLSDPAFRVPPPSAHLRIELTVVAQDYCLTEVSLRPGVMGRGVCRF